MDISWKSVLHTNSRSGERNSEIRNNVRGTYFEETNERCFGILSEGSGPLSSNDVKFNVGRTGDQLLSSELVSHRGDIRRANIVSCVKSTYLSH
jgi:hypothetical protein